MKPRTTDATDSNEHPKYTRQEAEKFALEFLEVVWKTGLKREDQIGEVLRALSRMDYQPTLLRRLPTMRGPQPPADTPAGWTEQKARQIARKALAYMWNEAGRLESDTGEAVRFLRRRGIRAGLISDPQ